MQCLINLCKKIVAVEVVFSIDNNEWQQRSAI